MNKIKLLPLLLAAAMLTACLSCLPAVASADLPSTSAGSSGSAADLTAGAVFEIAGGGSAAELRDDSTLTYVAFKAEDTLKITADVNIAYIYIKFYRYPTPYKVYSPTSNEMPLSQSGEFYQSFTDLTLNRFGNEIEISFENDTEISEIQVFSVGELPDSVHIWEDCLDRADLLVFSTHADDDQLFFGPAIAAAVASGADVQVCFIVDHTDQRSDWNQPRRVHEQLEGLWTLGIRNYPVLGRFPDGYSVSYSGGMYCYGLHGITLSNIVGYEVECIRRFHPQVVLTHDFEGEYGHGQHRVTAYALTLALGYAESSADFPATYEQYGVWSVKKAYIHSYAENQIVLDIDTPLDCFGGLTAFQISQKGYSCHVSQLIYWTTQWQQGTEDAPITNSSQITKYNPAYYGLYRTLVGPDTGNSMFENITFYKDQAGTEETTGGTDETTAPDETSAAESTPAPDETSAVPEDTTDAETAETSSAESSAGADTSAESSAPAEETAAAEETSLSSPEETTLTADESTLPATETDADDSEKKSSGCKTSLSSAFILAAALIIGYNIAIIRKKPHSN